MRGIDRLRAADPGAARLLLATQLVVTLAVAMAGEYVLVKLTGALQVAGPAAVVGAQHHAVLLIAMMLGAVSGLITVFAAPMFDTARERTISQAVLPIPGI